MLGANPMACNGSLWTVPDFRGKAKALRARGGKLVVVDPRRTETAALADQHLFIRPGADVFFLLGWCTRCSTRAWCGWAARAARQRRRSGARGRAAVRAGGVAARCGIEAGDDPRPGPRAGRAPRAAVYGRMGTCTQDFGTLSSWLVDVLNVLTGHLDEPGGAMFPKAAAFAANTAGARQRQRRRDRPPPEPRLGAPEVFGELPMTCLAEEIETPGEGQVRALHHGRQQPGAVGAQRPAPGARRWNSWNSWSAWTSTSTRPRATPT